MTDEEFLFRQTERERKRNSYGDRNKKRQGGKVVRLPSDNLTRKEREAMNGECKTYDVSKPVLWADFKLWPEEIKRMYITRLEDVYGVSGVQIAEMMGVHYQTFKVSRKMWKCRTRKGGNRAYDKERWAKFLDGGEKEPVELTEETPVIKEDAPSAENPVIEIKKEEAQNLPNIALLIQSLIGSGAKLTIEVTL